MGSGRPGTGSRPGLIAAVVVLVSVVLIGLAVMIGIRLGGNSLAEQTATGPVSTSQKSTTTTTTRVTRTSRTTTSTAPTTTRRATAVCDARVINADLGYPGSGARIIDCGGGWAVMASEHSGDPFWVSFQGGRWQAERGVSMYLMTCPDEAIARGAPAWLADKHLTCETVTSTSRPGSSRPSSRTTAPRTPTGTGASPTARPTSPTPTGPSGSPTATTSAATSTTSSPSTDPTATDTEDAEFAPAPAP